MSLTKAWASYVILAVTLVASRVSPEFKGLLKSVSLSFSNILGETGISTAIQPLYLPGGILVFVALLAVLLQGGGAKSLGKALGESSKTLIGAGFVLVFTIPMVRIFINSGVNGAELASMPVTTANFAADLVGSAFPALSATVGALGAFIAGSNTVSNMMVIKGILDEEDAKDAVRFGADGIVVSNHGGRQLDGVLSTAKALPSIADAVKGDLKIFVDSGIRTGLDVVRMLALGADCTLLGRSFVYALAAQGGAGVENLLDLYDKEMRVAMTLTGAKTISDLSRDSLVKMP